MPMFYSVGFISELFRLWLSFFSLLCHVASSSSSFSSSVWSRSIPPLVSPLIGCLVIFFGWLVVL